MMNLRATAVAALLLLVSCAGESTECTAENHCFLDPAGNATCEVGHTWVDPYTQGDYRCAPILNANCTPLTCAAAIAECGRPDDGCGGLLDCGACLAGYVCGVDFQCHGEECIPASCHDQGLECGDAVDGCGHAIECGVCPLGYGCQANACEHDGCQAHAESVCVEGDLYWRDSCGQLEEIREDCGTWGCASGQCLSWQDHWLCSPDYYDAADGCDCACGISDPDCELAGQTLYNCEPTETCSADGECVVAPCEHLCDTGTTSCQAGTVRACTTDANDCRVWGSQQACATGSCVDNATCATCTDECAPLGDQMCADGAVRTCVTGVDSCYDWSPPVSCGSGFCASAQACGACDNQCSAGETRCQFGVLESCTADGNGCLDFGAAVACDLGYCADGTTCGFCEPTTCAVEGKDCGTIDDGCVSTLDCGSCTRPETCGGAGIANVCGCTAESDLQFCFRQGKDCGEVTAPDNCGAARTVACGVCAESWACTANVCTPYSEPFDAVCNPEGWCWEHPMPFSHALNDVVVVADDDIWAIGSEHFILHYDGTSWSGTFDGKRPGLNALWLASSTDIWAVGDAGAVVRRQGGSWTAAAELGSTNNLTSIFGFSSNDVWVGGEHIGWHFDGVDWTPYSLPGDVMGMWGAASDDLWAVGKSSYSTGFLAHWDGTAWTTESTIAWAFDDIHGFTANDIWAVAKGHVLRWNGAYWSDVANHQCTSVWGVDPSDMWLSCYYGTHHTLVHYDGTTFEDADWETQWVAVGGDSSGTRIAVSRAGTVDRYVNERWVRLAPTLRMTSSTIDSVQVFSGGDAVAHVSYPANLVRRSGEWLEDPADVDRNYCVWGFSADDYWIGGMLTSSDPIAVRKVGSTLTDGDLPNTSSLRYPKLEAIWGTPDDLHGVGQTYWNYSSGNDYYSYGFYHFDGTSWSAPFTNASTDTGADSKVSFIDGASATDVWATDNGHTIWRLMAGTWQRFTTGSPLTSGDALAGLWVQSPARVHFAGTFGVLTFDSATGFGSIQATPAWAPASSRVVRALRDSTAHGRVAVGESGDLGVAWVFDNGTWQVQSVFPRKLRDIDVDGSQLVAVGEGGHIFRKP